MVSINVLPNGDWQVHVSEARAAELEALGWAYPDRGGTWRLTMAGAEHLLALSEST